jgi:two-component sensor histidine kinase
MIGTHVDISERKKSEATIKNLASQKSFLLKELQHRVKNSLALLQSMLQLQSGRYPAGSETHKALANAALRVQGLATLYTRLYAESGADVLDTRTFLSDLLDALQAGAEDAVRIEADLCRAEMSLGLLSPLGIVAAELVTNAMKHAAGPGKPAEIRVRTSCEAGRFELLVYDDGPGLPGAAAAALRGEAPEGAGFGLFMVRALADQIGAGIEAKTGSSEIRVSLAAPAKAEAAREPSSTSA